ncbi:MAG: copper-translocating P-type ATPase [Clostridia bacterium]|nr:copper-translocating P-type ATPase [Clostridia bacterium]
MDQYSVTGMSCAACSARVEKAVSGVEGVKSCSVNLLTNSMGVEGTAAAKDIIAAVKKAGYGAKLKSGKKDMSESDEPAQNAEILSIRARLITSAVFLIALMYLSMGHMMWNFPLPSFFNDNHIAMGIVQLLLCAVIMVINQKFFINGFKGILHKSPNMDTLVALGSSVSFIFSVYILFAMTRAQADMKFGAVKEYMMQFYFESAAMILTLVTVGKLLEAYSKGKTTNALKSLMKLAPETAVIIRNGKEVTVKITEVKTGDIFVVRPGENIPVDGIIIEGSTAVNESALTGESIPVDKEIGDSVSCATLNQSGFIKCEATRVGEDTSLSRIIKTVSDAAATKAPIAKTADKVSGIFVPVVMVIAFVTTAVWMFAGQTFGYALARGISVLVISCPCALGLATPVAIMVGNGVGAKNGILFKTAASLEAAGRTKIIALDKTGTVTSGEPQVTDIFPAENVTREELLEIAYSLEKKSEHPLAKAIIKISEEEKIECFEIDEFSALPGNGLSGILNNQKLFAGSMKFITSQISVEDRYVKKAEEFADSGKTPLLFVSENKLLGIIAVADVIKQDSYNAVKELENMGIRVVMLTGDNKRTAKAIGKQAGIDEVISDVLPQEKANEILKLRKQGKVAMVGDGINDAPALTSADTGIAIGAGTDIAIDAADVVLMKSNLSDVPAAINLSRATLKNIRENLFWAFFYNVIGIPLAAGVWIPIFGWTLNPMFGAAAMSLSSVCVVLNALRLNLIKIKGDRNYG